MHRIDGPGAVNNLFTVGDPAAPQMATVVTPEWLNDVQENIVKVITAAGITLEKGNYDQLLQAIAGLGNQNEVYNPGVTDIYVDATSGDDVNDGSQANPKKSLAAALAAVPLIVSDITIHLASGAYPGNSIFRRQGFGSVTIASMTAVATDVSLTGNLTIQQANVTFQNCTLAGNNSIQSGASVMVRGCRITAAGIAFSIKSSAFLEVDATSVISCAGFADVDAAALTFASGQATVAGPFVTAKNGATVEVSAALSITQQLQTTDTILAESRGYVHCASNLTIVGGVTGCHAKTYGTISIDGTLDITTAAARPYAVKCEYGGCLTITGAATLRANGTDTGWGVYINCATISCLSNLTILGTVCAMGVQMGHHAELTVYGTLTVTCIAASAARGLTATGDCRLTMPSTSYATFVGAGGTGSVGIELYGASRFIYGTLSNSGFATATSVTTSSTLSNG